MPSTAKALDYIRFNDAGCINQVIAIQWVRANIALSAYPAGTDLRVPASAAIRVTNTSTGAVINAFTLAAGKLRELTVGRNGGFTYAATVTFTDGSTLSGSQDVPVHPTPTCPLIT